MRSGFNFIETQRKGFEFALTHVTTIGLAPGGIVRDLLQYVCDTRYNYGLAPGGTSEICFNMCARAKSIRVN